MISISKTSSVYLTVFTLVFTSMVSVLGVPLQTLAQTSVSQTISVSPTLFDMKAAPGQKWPSELRVVNVNNYDLTIYPQVVNFTPLDETGRVNLLFERDSQTPAGSTLADWITISKEPIVIPRQQTVSIPFSVVAPDNAPPGGHYAAILIGTRPPIDGSAGQSQVQTAQFVSSLLFVRVDGNIIEQGRISDFSSERNIVESAETSFALSFENTGNVYLQPQGDIEIFNMWGSERGVIPVNHQTHYGRVVQDSTREFIFTWKGEGSFLDIGRYRAVATLGYGEEAKQFVTRTTYFWVIPYQQIAIALVSIVLVILFLGWVVRLYIKRMLLLAGINPVTKLQVEGNAARGTITVPKVSNAEPATHLLAPLTFGARDVQDRLIKSHGFTERFQTLIALMVTYRVFLLAVGVVIVCIVAIVWFLVSVNSEGSQFEVTIDNPDAPVTVSSEELYYQSIKEVSSDSSVTSITQPYAIEIVNRSGTLGVGAQVRVWLEEKGYHIEVLTSEMGASTDRTVIVYHPDLEADALALSHALQGALLSASDTKSKESITIFAGSDSLIERE